MAGRGWGQALSLLPDAGDFALLADDALADDVHPLYGRAPDARPLHPIAAAAGESGRVAAAG